MIPACHFDLTKLQFAAIRAEHFLPWHTGSLNAFMPTSIKTLLKFTVYRHRAPPAIPDDAADFVRKSCARGNARLVEEWSLPLERFGDPLPDRESASTGEK